MKCKNLRMDFAPKTQYDRTIKGAWKSAESNPKKHEEPKKYEEKEKTNMKKISRRDFLKASAATSGGALLTACGSSGSSTASTATSTSSAESGPRTVSYWIDLANTSGADVKSMGDLYCWKAIEANTGINVEFQHPASGQAAEQFNLVVAGNEMPDIMYYSWATNYSGGADAAIEDGKIIPLQDYMEEYAPNMTHYFELHPDMLADITTDSGNIYGFPAIYTSTAEGSKEWQGVFDREPFAESFIGLVIRTDYLEQVGMDVPVTYDDWYNVLKAFKEKLGLKYPMCFVQMFEQMSVAISAGFGVCVPVSGFSAAYGYGINEENKVEFGPVKDGYKDYLAFLNKLYSEGLLDNDYMVLDRTSVQAKILQGDVGAWIEMMPTGLGNLKSQILKDDPNNTFSAVGVHEMVNTAGTENRYHPANQPITLSVGAKTGSCQEVKTAMELLDYGWGEEGNMLLNWGIEGESYEMVDGWPQFTDAIIHNKEGKAPSTAHSMYRQLNGPFPEDHWQRLVSKTDYSLAEGEIDQNIASLNTWSYENGKHYNGLPATTLLDSEQAAYSGAFNEIGTYVGEMTAKFITGTESLDNFDDYVKNVYSMGMQNCLDIQQEALDRYNARVK